MDYDLDDAHDKWKGTKYLGTGFVASQVTKLITGNTIEDHTESEIYHDGDIAQSGTNTSKHVITSGIIGTVFGIGTSLIADGEKDLAKDAALGALAAM